LIGIRFPKPLLSSKGSNCFGLSLFPFNNSNLEVTVPSNLGLFEYKFVSHVSILSSIFILFPLSLPWSQRDKVE